MDLFLGNFHLVTAHWRLLATSNLLSSVELQYRNAYTTKLCGCLAFVKFIAWIVGDSPPLNQILVTTRTDFTAVINRISTIPLVAPFSTYLHQVVREIRLLVKQLNVKLIPVKIRAHLDDHF